MEVLFIIAVLKRTVTRAILRLWHLPMSHFFAVFLQTMCYCVLGSGCICGGGYCRPRSWLPPLAGRTIQMGRLMWLLLSGAPLLRSSAVPHPFLRMNCKTPHIFHVIVWPGRCLLPLPSPLPSVVMGEAGNP